MTVVDAGFASAGSDLVPPTTGALSFVAYPRADYAKADIENTTYLSFTDRTTLVLDEAARVHVNGAEPSSLRAVDLETEAIAWGHGAFGPAFAGHHARLVLRTDGEAYSIAEALAPSEEEARDRLVELERSIAARLEAPSDTPFEGVKSVAPPRFSFAREGDLIVLRDYEHAGPTERASRYLLFALVLLGAGVAASALTWHTWVATGATTTVLGYAVLAGVILVGAFAMSRIFAHARSYVPSHTPLAWFGDDRVVVLPWVSRTGAVDRRPEGRLGAAIVTAEIDEVVVMEDASLFAVTLTGPHGPIEILRSSVRADAERVAAVARLLLAEVASPKKARRAPRR